MRLSPDQIELFEAGCVNPDNDAAQQLLNVFGVEAADAVLERIPNVPIEILADLVTYFWHAMEHEAKRRVVLLDAQDGVEAAVVGHDHERHN